MMSWARTIFLVSLLSSSISHAKDSAFGLNMAVGAPFLQQVGINYQISESFGVAAGYNLLNLTSSSVKVSLAMPELLLNYHPFGGSYFIGAGVGQESFETSGSAVAGQVVSMKVDAMTTIFKTGWMWGIGDHGLWFGIDLSYVSPNNAKETITAPGVPTTDPAYLDAVDAVKKFGKTSYRNLPFARFGWLF